MHTVKEKCTALTFETDNLADMTEIRRLEALLERIEISHERGPGSTPAQDNDYWLIDKDIGNLAVSTAIQVIPSGPPDPATCEPSKASENRSDASSNAASTKLPRPCLLLNKLPGELRTTIYECVLRQSPAIIFVDLKHEEATGHRSSHVSPSYSLALTCSQIHKECGSLRYDVNKVLIFTPVFSIAASSQEEREGRDIVALRLHNLANSQPESKQLRRVCLFLGRLSKLAQMRWSEFFISWMSIRDAVVRISGIHTSLELSFEVISARLVMTQYTFSIWSSLGSDQSDEMSLMNGSVVDMMDVERERLKKIKATIMKTIPVPK